MSKVFPIAQWHNRLLLDSAKAALVVSVAAASKFLHLKVMFPSTHKKKDYVERLVYKYLKQTLSYLGHVALEAVKVQEHLKLIGEVMEKSQGMNSGHRGKWVTMLSTLNGKFEMSVMPQRGLRLLDGASTKRALPEAEASEEDALSFSSDDSGSEEGGAGDETGSQAV